VQSGSHVPRQRSWDRIVSTQKPELMVIEWIPGLTVARK
jgi:hypothetical protein